MLQLTSPRRAENRLKYLAGSESAMGAWIGDVVPETAAAGLRDAIARADALTEEQAGSQADKRADAS
jgi:UDPglucose--hexose-1-phosphate uridylyltransferase